MPGPPWLFAVDIWVCPQTKNPLQAPVLLPPSRTWIPSSPGRLADLGEAKSPGNTKRQAWALEPWLYEPRWWQTTHASSHYGANTYCSNHYCSNHCLRKPQLVSNTSSGTRRLTGDTATAKNLRNVPWLVHGSLLFAPLLHWPTSSKSQIIH